MLFRFLFFSTILFCANYILLFIFIVSFISFKAKQVIYSITDTATTVIDTFTDISDKVITNEKNQSIAVLDHGDDDFTTEQSPLFTPTVGLPAYLKEGKFGAGNVHRLQVTNVNVIYIFNVF